MIDPREVPVVVYAILTVPPVAVDASAGAVMTSFGAFGFGVTGFAMSVWMSVWLSAARYTRTSSIRPAKNCPYSESPPICNGFADVANDPVCALLATCAPFTYKRSVDPSYVAARCDHTFAATAVELTMFAPLPPNVPPTDGFGPELVVASK